MNTKNFCMMTGRLTNDVDSRTNDSTGKTTHRFSIAVSRSYKNAEGKYEADFINCIAFGKLGETIAKYFHKGATIEVAGEWRTGNYTNKDGQKIYTNDLWVSDFGFPMTSSQSQNNSTATAPQSMPTAQAPVTSTPPGFDAVPAGADNFLPFS